MRVTRGATDRQNHHHHVLGFPEAPPCSAFAPAPFAPLPETAGGQGAHRTSGRATHAARGVAHAACGDATGSRFPLSRFAIRACSLSFAPLLTARRAAPSLLPTEEARSRERAHDARAI